MRRLLPLLLILSALTNPVLAQCDASFGVSINGATAHFSADSTLPGILHKWRLGDGNIAFGPNTSHTYNAPGVYSVWHIVADSLGQCSDSVMKQVNISFQASCQASFVYSRDSVFPNKYYFSSTSTASGGTISSYQWILDGNTVVSNSPSLTISPTQGMHEICLSITTTAGCSSTTCDSIVVDSAGNCNLNAGFDTTLSGQTLEVEALSTGAHLTHFWKFGDGNTAYGSTATHVYDYAGSFTITHYITDSSSNCIDSARMTIAISEPVSCQALSWIKADSLVANQYHFFSQSVSTGGAIQTYAWTINGNIISTAQGFSRILSPGNYQVCLSIITTAGCSSTICDSLIVPGGGIIIDTFQTESVSVILSYPNPIPGGTLTLPLILDNQQKVRITVYNTRGVAVLVQERNYSQGYNRIQVPVNALQRGQYFIDIQYGNTRKRSVFQKL